MGSETGTFAYTDFSYDLDNLYMTCLVYRSQARSEEPFPDGLTFCVESKGASTDILLSSAYRFSMLPDGTLSVSKGSNTTWTQISSPSVKASSTITQANYRIELGIPWTAIGLGTAPIGGNLSVNLEIVTGDGTQQIVERIPDALPTKPATWVLLKLIEPDPDGLLLTPRGDQQPTARGTAGGGSVYNLSGQKALPGYHGIVINQKPDRKAKKIMLP